MQTNLYHVDYEGYYNGLNDDVYFSSNKIKVKEAMNQLIQRYNIFEKEVLSIGSSFGFEKYWFYKNRCGLTLVDIDESNNIKPYISKIPLSNDENNLKFYLGDAYEFIKCANQKYDICYYSGFTVDELRRGEIQRKNIFKIILSRLGVRVNKWPSNENIFCELVLEINNNLLKEGGLFIVQSYSSGINYVEDKYCIELLKAQLKENGIILLDLFSFKEYPTVSLIVGFKGTEHNAGDYYSKLTNKLTKFHGRSDIRTEILNTYQLL